MIIILNSATPRKGPSAGPAGSPPRFLAAEHRTRSRVPAWSARPAPRSPPLLPRAQLRARRVVLPLTLLEHTPGAPVSTAASNLEHTPGAPVAPAATPGRNSGAALSCYPWHSGKGKLIELAKSRTG